MLKNATKITHRRFLRKVRRDGLKQGIIESVETVGRNFILPAILSDLIIYKNIQTYDVNDLNTVPELVHQIDNYDVSYEPTHDLPFVVLLSGGYLTPDQGIIFDEDFALINAMLRPQKNAESVLMNRLSRMAIINPSLFRSLLNNSLFDRKDIKHLEIAAPLFPYYINYYHWLVKTLPKVRYVQDFEDETNWDVPFLLPRPAPSWMGETLKLLGVPDNKIIYSESDIYHVEKMVATSWVAHSSDDYNWLKKKMLDTVHNVRQSPTNILISRRDAIDRQITNRSEVVEMLSKYGFEEVVLSDIPVEECIQMFNHADIIVGAHGAGFADVVFAEDASVIELYGSRYTNTYNNISQRLGLDYTRIQCEPVYGDLMVDTDKLEAIIKDKMNKLTSRT